MQGRRLSKIRFALALAALAGMAAVTPAAAADPHALYEQNCSGCHAPHAREFVERSLDLQDGQVVGRKGGAEIGAFLAGGHGRLAAADVPVMVDHLSAILRAGGLFFRRCAMCHGRGVDFARRDVIETDGRIVGRYSGRDIEVFLGNQGRLDGPGVAIIMEMLRRQLRTRK